MTSPTLRVDGSNPTALLFQQLGLALNRAHLDGYDAPAEPVLRAGFSFLGELAGRSPRLANGAVIHVMPDGSLEIRLEGHAEWITVFIEGDEIPEWSYAIEHVSGQPLDTFCGIESDEVLSQVVERAG
jgi:hypothetical protein